jgi:DNA-binding MarR family transcriptional regulator
MAELMTNPSPLFLRDLEVRQGIELLYFGYRDLTRGADALLEQEGFGRAHHRALYFIARKPGLAVRDLLRLLGITKQSLSRVLADLQHKGLVQSEQGRADRRQRLLQLTEQGRTLERQLFEVLRLRMQEAYAQAGSQAVAGFWAVLMGLIDAEHRLDVERLARLAHKSKAG